MQDPEKEDRTPPRLTRHALTTWIINASGVTALVTAGWWVATTRPLP